MRILNKKSCLAVSSVSLLALSAASAVRAASVSPIYAFSGGTLDGAPNDGANPQATLILNFDGDFYGTTVQGGPTGVGTIFQATAAGAETPIHTFTGFGADGAFPVGNLFPGINSHGADGFLYGATAQGGRFNNGTLYKVTSTGTYTNLHSFQGPTDGASPQGGLFEGTDGNFYGTTFSGGTGNDGVVFQITPAGVYTVIHTFSATDATGVNADGAGPAATLVLNIDGNFYGTTTAGGEHGLGVLFRISKSGKFKTLYSFQGTDGADPVATLIPDILGNLYGTTQQGGANGTGEIFEWKHSGTLTVLHSFPSVGSTGVNTDGAYPVANLIWGKNGALYGTASLGGGAGFGTIYSVTTGGTFTTLYSFAGGSDGASPQSGLFPGTDGKLYGTAFGAGTYGFGTIYALTY